MFFSYKDLNNCNQSIELPISLEKFNQLNNDFNTYDLGDLENWSFWTIRNYLFKVLIFDKKEEETIKFLSKTHLCQFDFSENYGGQKIEIIELVYHFYYSPVEIFLCSEPNDLFYPSNIIKQRLELILKLDTIELEHILKQILDALGVSYLDWENNDYPESENISNSELNLAQLFGDFILKCWATAQQLSHSKTIGFILYGSGGGGYIDLDTGKDIGHSKDEIHKYVQNKK